jgi:hypothetical protein
VGTVWARRAHQLFAAAETRLLGRVRPGQRCINNDVAVIGVRRPTKFDGRTSASQAEYAGSIPVIGSTLTRAFRPHYRLGLSPGTPAVPRLGAADAQPMPKVGVAITSQGFPDAKSQIMGVSAREIQLMSTRLRRVIHSSPSVLFTVERSVNSVANGKGPATYPAATSLYPKANWERRAGVPRRVRPRCRAAQLTLAK